MPKYLLSENLHQLLDRHKQVFPTKRGFQNYVKNTLRARFSSDSYSDARNRRPTQYQFLLNLLIYLKETESQFIAQHLGDDWKLKSVEEIAETYIVIAPDDYMAQPRSTDTIKLGPTHLAAELFSRIHDDGLCRPATIDDIEILTKQFAIGVVDSYNLDFTPPSEDAEQEGVEKFGYSHEQLRTTLRNAIKYCSNSVWIRPDLKNPELTLLSWIAPVRDDQYQSFRT